MNTRSHRKQICKLTIGVGTRWKVQQQEIVLESLIQKT